jgi:hypothetical protein
MTFTDSAWVVMKKTFSIALIFNALITIASISGIIYAFVWASPSWKPYSPFLINGNFFWIAMAAGLINIFPSAAIGRSLHTGRFLFHHYVYGAFVVASSSAFVIWFTPQVPLLSLFLVDTPDFSVNASRVFLLAGLALFLDDLPDVSLRIEHSLNWIKCRACQAKRLLHYAQIITGSVSIYCAVAILFSTIYQDPARALPNSFAIVTLFLTGITSFALAKRGAWLKITPPGPLRHQ